MVTNDLKKGTEIILRNGWKAKIEDNAKGQTRMCTVYGDFTEMGSVYSHDIMKAKIDGNWQDVTHTPVQQKLRQKVRTLGF